MDPSGRRAAAEAIVARDPGSIDLRPEWPGLKGDDLVVDPVGDGVVRKEPLSVEVAGDTRFSLTRWHGFARTPCARSPLEPLTHTGSEQILTKSPSAEYRAPASSTQIVPFLPACVGSSSAPSAGGLPPGVEDGIRDAER